MIDTDMNIVDDVAVRGLRVRLHRHKGGSQVRGWFMIFDAAGVREPSGGSAMVDSLYPTLMALISASQTSAE